jgi:GNAT superfamily N-acetyltransferase
MEYIEKGTYRLERLSSAQWEEYKTIRLEALKSSPEVFGSNYARESAYSQEEWIALLKDESRAIFGLYSSDSLIGLSGVVLNKDDRSVAILISSFIRAPYRGIGLSKLFYQARINWARSKSCSSVEVSHREGNDASKAANQHFGFKYTHTRQVLWPDGVSANEVMYVLTL